MRDTLIVGNLGYIGPVLIKYLASNMTGGNLIGLDTGYFSGCLINPLDPVDLCLKAQYFLDVRDVTEDCLRDVENIVYLAAISNDPMGNSFEQPTLEINSDAAYKLASLAKKNGVKNFVYASSCSIYGGGSDVAKSESSEVNPLTAYARSKIDFESKVQNLADCEFVVTCLRFATACGVSPRLRLDLVLNDFVASALLSGKIEILSNGEPWRPIIDVEEMCRAILWALQRVPPDSPAFMAINVGFNSNNFTIRDLAYLVKDIVKDTQIKINPLATPDKRTYKVNFSLYESLTGFSGSDKPLEKTIIEIVGLIKESKFNEVEFRSSHLIRLNAINYLYNHQFLDKNLRWQLTK